MSHVTCTGAGCCPSEQGDLTEWDLQVVERKVWYFQDKHAGPSGLGDLEVMEYIACIRPHMPQAVGARRRRFRPPSNDRSKIHA